ncbi:MAG: OsmC family protein, partial [Pseudomonadota bacterium]
MHDLPHRYSVSANGTAADEVTLSGGGGSDIRSMPPPEFGGPGGYWSPESLLVAAVADCFILSFKAIARASRFDWIALDCRVDGELDRVDRRISFTAFKVTAELTVAEGTNTEKAERLLEKAEQACLITNSLIAESHLSTSV